MTSVFGTGERGPELAGLDLRGSCLNCRHLGRRKIWCESANGGEDF